MTDLPTRTVARPVANLGNTCYMNCVLQALAHAPELCLAMDCEAHRSICPVAAENREKRRRSSSPDGSASSNESETRRRTGTRKSRRSGRKSPPDCRGDDSSDSFKFCALCEVEEHLQSVHDSTMKDKPVAPETFVNGFIEQVAPWFRLGVQEDSHEFLRLLIDAMQKSCHRARDAQRHSNPQDDEAPNGGAAKIEDERDTEYPFSLFRGTVQSTVTCGSCNASSSTLDPIEDIGLEVTAPVPTGATSRTGTERLSRNTSPVPAPTLYDVETAFHRYSRAEALDAGYKCEKCGRVGKATKQSRLASIPPILTLHLKRFRYGSGGVSGAGDAAGGRRSRSELGQLLAGSDLYGGKSGSAKVEGHIKFDVLFDLHPFLTQELQQKHSNMVCRLFAVIVHAGKSSHSGHYIAYVRNIAKNNWWKMDDGRVTMVSMSEVQNSEAYMLFYRIVQHPVAIKLEQEYKIKMEARETSKAEVDDIKTLAKSRKRPLLSAFEESGETWFRSKTSMPPYLRSLVTTIEDRLANNVIVQPELMRLIQEYVEGEGAQAVSSQEPSSSSAGQKPGKLDVVDESCEEHRRAICKILYHFALWLENEKGIKPEKMLSPQPKEETPATTTPLTTSLEENTIATVSDEKLVAVVEPEEDMDLL